MDYEDRSHARPAIEHPGNHRGVRVRVLAGRSQTTGQLMKPSVVHMLAPAAFGGLESVVLTLSGGQAAAGHRVLVLASFTSDPTGEVFWDALAQIPGVHAVPLVLGGRQYLAERRQLRAVLRDFDADLLHTHGYRPDVLSAPVARGMGVPTVTTVHGFTGGGRKNRFYEWLQRRSYRRFGAVVAVSGKLEKELVASGVPRDVVHCIPNAWAPTQPPLSRAEARQHLGLPENGSVIGWVGRLSGEKAPDVALSAMELVTVHDPRIHLSFVGTGPLKAELEVRASANGMGERVHWHGVVPGAGRYLQAFDALLISSWTEGTPIVLLEGMAAQVPIVTTAVGGIPNVVSDREAELVEAGDVEGMSRALLRTLRHSQDVQDRVAAARGRLEREFAVGPWVDRYSAIYESLLTE
ncbi:MAG: glycosyltransferase [Dehalococcoidia bacterium]